MQILHLEDSSTDAMLISHLLRRELPECAITHVTCAIEYERAIAQGTFDVILSDYSMPDYDGLQALSEARQRAPQTPFLFLSGMIGEERAVEALKCGAADYVIKDRPARLVAAIRQAVAFRHESNRRREADAAREAAETRIREQASLLDKARDAIFATDLEQRITYWNASAERLYGVKADDAVGHRLPDIGIEFDPMAVAAARTTVLAKGEWRGELRVRTPAGTTVLVDSTWSLVVEHGRPRSILAIDSDVTERKKLEAQLLRAQRLESVGTLAGGVAHDLNNVLTPVLLALDLLAPRVMSADERSVLEKTRASVSHGAALVRQLLAFARGSEGERTAIDPAAALASVEPLVRQWLPPSIDLVVRHAHVPWTVEANDTQFSQAIVNLALNARDAMPTGGRLEIVTDNVSVDHTTAAANPGTHPGPFVRITIADTGTGMPREVVDRIFDPFFTTKAPGKGTGLGLSMVASILKNHGGFVQVESEIGHGTRFHLYFPATPRNTKAADPAAPAKGPGVLLVDDEPAVRDALRALLQRAGYAIIPAGDATSALREFEQCRDRISLVITDMMLPDRSGVEVVKSIRAQSPQLPIIAISGMMASGNYDELLRLTPPVQCLSKPLPPRVLLSAAERALHAG